MQNKVIKNTKTNIITLITLIKCYYDFYFRFLTLFRYYFSVFLITIKYFIIFAKIVNIYEYL